MPDAECAPLAGYTLHSASEIVQQIVTALGHSQPHRLLILGQVSGTDRFKPLNLVLDHRGIFRHATQDIVGAEWHSTARCCPCRRGRNRRCHFGTIIGLGSAWGRPYAPLVRETCAWLKKQIAAIADKRETNELRSATEEEEQQHRAEVGEELLAETLREGSRSGAGGDEESTAAEPVMVLRAYGWE